MEEAKDFCLARGASLLNLTSLEQSQELQDWWEGKGRQEGQCGRQAPALWLELHRLADDQWGDDTTNTPAEFTRWYSTEPNNHGGREDCAIVITDPALAKATQTANFHWMDVPCDIKGFPFHQDFKLSIWTLCQREVDPNELPALKKTTAEKVEMETINGCLPGYTRLGSGCYMFSNQRGTAEEGKEICRRAGGYLVEVETKEEWELLGEEWKRLMKMANGCFAEQPFFWVGISDAGQEGSWRLGRSGEEVEFTAWEEEGREPNSWGPGGAGTGDEDCVMAGLKVKIMAWKWHDAPCGYSVFPLCEQHQGEDLEAWKREPGPNEVEETPALPLNSTWVRVGRFTFLPTLDGVNWADAGTLCEEAGGSLAAPETREEWEELRAAMESSWPQPGFIRSMLSWVTGAEERQRYGWWLAATDAGEEGRWRWQGGRENISYTSAWFNYSPRNENLFSFGGADCAIAVHRQNFLRRSLAQISESVKQFGGEYDPSPEDDQEWRDVLEAEEEDIKWTDVSCFATFIPGFDLNLSPVCQMYNN